ncbi:pilin [Vibrio syngnathi]|uniref:Fimbrial protein n=1 Tax=Vibrio syngnathi TaxID=3034029 RepID=A0AA34TLZ7_9VIBR|nr:pilin [Vibrio syngnathi]ARP37340.1 Fimbrial protein precursor [Vibrio syngnathi]
MKNKNKRTNQKGFTLIELMIVVAIIGVLSAIAVPAYKDYVSKSELSSGLKTVKALVTPAELYIQENGALTATIGDIGSTGSANSLGGITTTTANVIEFTFNSTSAINGTKVTLTRDASTGWSCAFTAGTGVTLPTIDGCS